MTKTAQLAVRAALRESLAGTGVTVNSVLPGPTRSEGVIDFFGKMAKEQRRRRRRRWRMTSSRSTGRHRSSAGSRRVEEVANMVVYVCSKQASATTGAALRVEGGLLRRIG